MNKVIYIVIFGIFVNLQGMEHTSESLLKEKDAKKGQEACYLNVLPVELRKMIIQFDVDLKRISTLDKLLVQLKSLAKVKHLGWAREVYNFLLSIKDATSYAKAHARIQKLSQRNELTFLFDSTDFTQLLIHELLKYRTTVELEKIAKALETKGAKKWLEGRPLQLELLKAVEREDINKVKGLLEAAVSVNVQDHNGFSPLFSAAESNNKDMAALLIAHGAYINIQSTASVGFTPLSIAAIRGHTEIVNMLLKKGANPHLKDDIFGQTALDVAKKAGYQEIVNLLSKAVAQKR